MRKNEQKQILELIVTVWDGIAYALSPNISQTSAMAVLQDCCSAVNAIDHSLKSGLSNKRYSFYKQLNTDLLKMIDSLRNGLLKGHVDSVITENLDHQFNLIYNELFKESEVKLEIVFLPYKSSMWDSLESIWRAAKDDPTCDCYVIPIPYYDRNSDSSVSEMHYEGGDFPMDVPITHFGSYDISERRPDIVYIHNPFDQYNRVTTVHPNYFSSELKKYVDTLIYVPYFVMGGGISKTDKNLLPVYQNMDLMIVQSEKYKQFFKEFIPENKLAALGSPKVDRMLYLDNNQPPIPKEWEEVIKDKKVVMYNISISGILQHGTKAIKKMEYVFTQFIGRDDVVLLWRPHPLLEATLKSMNPSLLKAYEDLKEKYLADDIGIYDTTPDITASIAIADAYIGEDTSSIVHLFGVVGKPILLLDMEYDREPSVDDLASLSFHDCFIEGNIAWFVANGYNALCKMDLANGEVEVMAKIPTSKTKFRLYSDLYKIDNKIILSPYYSDELLEYDLHDKTFLKTTLPNAGEESFDRILYHNNRLYFKPQSYPAVLEYEIKTGNYKFHKEWLEEYKCAGNQVKFYLGSCIRENSLLLASAAENHVLEIDMKTGNSKLHTIGKAELNYFAMDFDGKDYWLVPNEGKSIVRWNYETGEVTEYDNFPRGFEGETRGFCGIVYCGTYMLAFPREANMIIRIDIATGNMSEFKIPLPYKEGERRSCYQRYSSQYYFVKKLDKQHILALTSYDSSFVIINLESGEYDIKKCRLDEESIISLLRSVDDFSQWDDNIVYAARENQYLSINRFLETYVLSDRGHNRDDQKQAYSTVVNNIDGTCGQKVHCYVKEHFFSI